MKRRDFLLLRAGAEQARPLRSPIDVADTGAPEGAPYTRDVAELSCELLFMRFVDAEADGTTERLFDVLASDLRGASSVRLTNTSWLARAELRSRVEAVLGEFQARGGEITKQP